MSESEHKDNICVKSAMKYDFTKIVLDPVKIINSKFARLEVQEPKVPTHYVTRINKERLYRISH